MRKNILITFWLTILVFHCGCSSDPNEKANALFVKASLSMEKVKAGTDSYSTSLPMFLSAFDNISRIITEYPSSNVAASLMSGQTMISGLSLHEFREQKNRFEIYASAEQDLLSCAQIVADGAENAYVKVQLVTGIASRYLDLGQNSRAEELLTSALSMVSTLEGTTSDGSLYSSSIEGALYQSWASSAIAEVYFKDKKRDRGIDLLRQSEELALELRDKSSRNSVLLGLAGQYAKANQFDKAIEIIKTFDSPDDSALGLIKIAREYFKLKQYEIASEMLTMAYGVAQEMEYDWSKDSRLVQIADVYTKAGLLAQALGTIETINSIDDKTKALAEVSGGYYEAGQKDSAKQILSQSLEMTHKIERKYGKSSALTVIAGEYGDFNNSEKAMRILSDAYKVAQEIDNESSLKSYALIDIADGYFQAGQNERATQILSEAQNTVKIITEDKHWVLRSILYSYAKAGQFYQALGIVRIIDDPGHKAWALVEIADEYIKRERRPNESESSILREIVNTTAPVSNFWR